MGVGQHLARGDVAVLGNPVPLQPQLTDYCEPSPVPDPVDARSAPPRIGARRVRLGREHRRELLECPVDLAFSCQLGCEHVPQFDENLDVERRVPKPLDRQRPRGPVRRRVGLLQAKAQLGLHHRGQAHPWAAKQPPGDFGIEQLPRPVTKLGQARKVLGRGVQHGLGPGENRVEPGQVRACDRVDQHSPGAVTAELHEEGTLAVPEARCPLRVDGDRSAACREPRDRRRKLLRSSDHRRQPLGRLKQVDDVAP